MAILQVGIGLCQAELGNHVRRIASMTIDDESFVRRALPVPLMPHDDPRQRRLLA
jgi:hypothetical protein